MENIAYTAAIDPAACYERRKIIIQAIQFEIDLHEVELRAIESERDIAQIGLNQIEEALCDAEQTVSSLEDARNSLIDTLTDEQRQEFVASGA